MKNIPVLHAHGKTLAEAYEKALCELYLNGCRFKTQYDKPEDPESIDASMNITIDEPLSDPMIHKAFPGGINDLKEYVMELNGDKDHWCRCLNNPKDTRWEYTYHQRFETYGKWKEQCFPNGPEKMCGSLEVNQIDWVIKKLTEQPFTRQAQMITWMPNIDLGIKDPPCMQSIWFRMAEEDNVYYLNTNIRFRSNDAWGAYFMNSFGLTMFIKENIAVPISCMTGKEVKLARMNWQADSWHIYGKDIQQAKERLFDKIIHKLPDSDKMFPIHNDLAFRVYDFNDPDIQEIYNEAEAVVNEKIANYDKEQREKKQ